MLEFVPKFRGSPKSEALGVSLFSLLVNPRLTALRRLRGHKWLTVKSANNYFIVCFNSRCFSQSIAFVRF